ncbi:YHYH protein [Hydrogenophaga sp. PAMC20947]|uniref:YHYH protein n=1 Tax=Hydrogenophaga sp. PAMC20947 TaxID=2565558 RepID=UPI00109DCDA0|nr:YHYH protein [Hydrogenophaga sp. PAMC20947]QCB45974.1 YHYH protein [Hydrogenophaga sp. PAMC20947]
MKNPTTARWIGLLTIVCVVLAACGGGDDDESIYGTTVTSADVKSVEPANFLGAGLASAITTVSCTLSGGTSTNCYKIVTHGAPPDHAVGPFCPTNTSSSGAGMWIENGQTYDLSGEFIKNLATFYSDSNWKMYNTSTGAVTVTDTQALFEAAAIPNTTLNNYCVEGKMSYVGGGISRTLLIPVTPVPLSSTASIDQEGVGVALNGIVMDAPAPVANIKAAYTIAAFDDQGGHINPHTGYHYHAATGASHQVASSDGHAALIGYALDGFGIFALNDTAGSEATDLDTCRGHTDSTRGYHYHVASPGENMHIGCFKGEQGSSS